MRAPRARPLKRSEPFKAVYRQGHWARGVLLSVGALARKEPATHVGIRTRRGLKGAVVRNRLKRQLRAILASPQLVLSPGLDLVIVIHPGRSPVSSQALTKELNHLCRKLGLVRRSS